jgi:hypothetical protein
MTAETLNGYSTKVLAEMAKSRGVRGWHSMRKDQLVKALLKVVRQKSNDAKARAARSVAPPQPRTQPAVHTTVANGKSASTNGKPVVAKVSNGKASLPPPKPKDPEVEKRLEQYRNSSALKKDLSYLTTQIAAAAAAKTNGRAKPRAVKDRLVVMVRDSYWLQAYWELTRTGVDRAQAALGQEWHSVKPVLRLVEVTDGGTTSAVETPVRDIEIHGGVNNWYVDVQDPPKSYRIDIGYLTAGGKLFVLARSNVVTTPKAAAKDHLDENWADVAADFERIYAQSGGHDGDGNGSVELQEVFEERLRRPMGSSLIARCGQEMEGILNARRGFHFEIDAEMIVFGKTEPDARVTLQGEPVKLRPDGTFTMRYALPNARQVIPAVAHSAGGLEQRTVVLAVERNTKAMEPLLRDGGNGGQSE